MADIELFDLPNEDDLKPIVQELALTELQRKALKLTIRHAREDLRDHFRVGVDRAERRRRIDKLKTVNNAIDRLLRSVGRTPAINDFVNDCLPTAAREAISRGASPALIAEVTGRSAQSLEDAYAIQSAGLAQGVAILAEQLQRIKEPLEQWMADEVHDRGGAKPDLIRHHLVRTLANASRDIIDQEATGTADGRFVKLVAGVFHICRIKAKGMESLVERVLAHRPGR